MKLRTIAMALSLSAGLLVTGAVAQHDQHHSDPGQAPVVGHEAMSGKMPEMMSTQREASALTDQLLKSFAGIEKEKDPAVLQTKLTQHGVLLRNLKAKIEEQARAMEKMHGQMMMGGMMGATTMGGEQKKP